MKRGKSKRRERLREEVGAGWLACFMALTGVEDELSDEQLGRALSGVFNTLSYMCRYAGEGDDLVCEGLLKQVNGDTTARASQVRAFAARVSRLILNPPEELANYLNN